MGKVNVFLLTIFVIASLSSLSHGLILNNIQVGTLSVQGVLSCTLNADPNAPPVSSQTVFLTCAGSTTNLGQAITNPAGAFTIVVKIAETLIFNPSICRVTVNLPVGTCGVFPPDGVLSATAGLIGIVQTNTGTIANFITGPFVRNL